MSLVEVTTPNPDSTACYSCGTPHVPCHYYGTTNNAAYPFQDTLPANSFLKGVTVILFGNACDYMTDGVRVYVGDIGQDTVISAPVGPSTCSCGQCTTLVLKSTHPYGPGNYWPKYNYGGTNFLWIEQKFCALPSFIILEYDSK